MPKEGVADGGLGMLLKIYRIATSAAQPAAWPLLRQRAARGKEVPERLPERLGEASITRPEGPLFWFHAASVGETIAVLPLICELRTRFPALNVLLTTITVTSAKIAAARLPEGAIHQFAPLDSLSFVRRFLDYWQPDLGLFIESEIWPNLIVEAKRRNVGLVLLNARMSERSYKRWMKLSSLSRPLFSRFDLVLAQTASIADRLNQLGARQSVVTGNLKYDAPPPPVDRAVLEALSAQVQGRPIFFAASTHPGEDEIIIEAHKQLRAAVPDVLTVIAPRHPERGEAIAGLAGDRGLKAARRAVGQALASETEVYIADTLGELGLFYALAPVSFIGGSLIPHGGQNPIEAVKIGSSVLSGRHTQNFSEVYGLLEKEQGCLFIEDADGLVAQLRQLLEHPDMAQAMKTRAAHVIATLCGAQQRTLEALSPFLPGGSRSSTHISDHAA